MADKNAKHVDVLFTGRQIEAIDKFWHDNDRMSRTHAIRDMIEMAIAQIESPPAEVPEPARRGRPPGPTKPLPTPEPTQAQIRAQVAANAVADVKAATEPVAPVVPLTPAELEKKAKRDAFAAMLSNKYGKQAAPVAPAAPAAPEIERQWFGGVSGRYVEVFKATGEPVNASDVEFVRADRARLDAVRRVQKEKDQELQARRDEMAAKQAKAKAVRDAMIAANPAYQRELAEATVVYEAYQAKLRREEEEKAKS